MGPTVNAVRAVLRNQFATISIPARILILNTFLFAFGSYLVTPYLAIFYEKEIGLSPQVIGLVTGAMTFVQFGGGIVGASLAQRFGLRKAMIAALVFRALGLSMLAASVGHHGLVIPGALFIAFAPALYLPSNRAYLVHESDGQHAHSFTLSLANSALNAGMSLGPLVAVAVFTSHAQSLLIGVAALFALLIVLHLRLGEIFPQLIAGGEEGLCGAIRGAWRPLIFTVATYYLYFHFQSFIGLYVANVFDIRFLPAILFLNFSVLVVLQPLIAKRIAAAAYGALLLLGFVFLAAGFATMSAGSIAALFAGTFIMSVGQVMLFLRSDLEMLKTSGLSPAMAFGLQRLTIGIGGALGSGLAGVAFEYCKSHGGLSGFWTVPAAQGMLAALAAFALTKEIP